MEEKIAGTGTSAHGCLFCDTVKPFLEHCWTDATRNHFRASRVEFLKGIRSLLDKRIEHLSRHQGQQGTRVPVE